jgi:hypothetical protein
MQQAGVSPEGGGDAGGDLGGGDIDFGGGDLGGDMGGSDLDATADAASETIDENPGGGMEAL